MHEAACKKSAALVAKIELVDGALSAHASLRIAAKELHHVVDSAPEPAAVMACRHFLSCTSPAANTPGTLVFVSPGSVTCAAVNLPGLHSGQPHLKRI